jgi:hypothetical protein
MALDIELIQGLDDSDHFGNETVVKFFVHRGRLEAEVFEGG